MRKTCAQAVCEWAEKLGKVLANYTQPRHQANMAVQNQRAYTHNVDFLPNQTAQFPTHQNTHSTSRQALVIPIIHKAYYYDHVFKKSNLVIEEVGLA